MNETESLKFLKEEFLKLSKYKNYNDIDFSTDFPLPLFHGTDKKILNLSTQEISNIRKFNRIAFDSLYKNLLNNNFNPLSSEFCPKPDDPEKNIKLKNKKKFDDDCIKMFGKTNYQNIVNTFIHADSISNQDSNLWNYNYFFATTGTMRAYNYAALSSWFGELGYFTHWLYTAAIKKIDLSNIPEIEKEAINYISSIYDNDPQPIILYIDKIKMNEIENENKFNKAKTPFLMTQDSYKIKKDIDIHLYPYFELSKETAYKLDSLLDNIYANIGRFDYKDNK